MSISPVISIWCPSFMSCPCNVHQSCRVQPSCPSSVSNALPLWCSCPVLFSWVITLCMYVCGVSVCLYVHTMHNNALVLRDSSSLYSLQRVFIYFSPHILYNVFYFSFSSIHSHKGRVLQFKHSEPCLATGESRFEPKSAAASAD